MTLEFPGSVIVAPPAVPALVMAPPIGAGTEILVLPVAGPTGAQGPQGDPGDAAAALAFVQTVTNQSSVQINHGLAFKPAGIICLDTSVPPVVVEYASISYPFAGVTELAFGFPFNGTIYVS